MLAVETVSSTGQARCALCEGVLKNPNFVAKPRPLGISYAWFGMFLHGVRMLQTVATLFAGYGPIIFLMILFLCNFGLPLAKSLVVATAGILAATRPAQAPLLLVCCGLGLHAGDWMLFTLGRKLGHEGLRRRPLDRLLPERLVARAQSFIDANGTSSLLLARVTPFVRGPVFFLLGALRMPPLRFNLINFSTAMVYVFVFFGIGFLLGERQDQLLSLIRQGNLWIATALTVLAAAFLWRRNQLRGALS